MRDLAGQRFGRLEALGPTDRRERGGVVWRCRCDCGRECEASSDSLVRGRATSCGCARGEPPRRGKDLAGRRFGRLTVEERSGSRGGRALWKCACDCGRACEATTYELTGGKKASCGRCGGRAGAPDGGGIGAGLRCGARYGHLVAVSEAEAGPGRPSVWRCVCDCNRVVRVSALDLERGLAAACGQCGYGAE